MFWLKALLAWLGLAALAVGLGALRVLFLQPIVGEALAHVLGTLVGCALFLAFIHVFVARTGPHAKHRLVLLGLFWTVLTICFEFGFGRYVRGLSWQVLLADYNLLAGRIWVLVLATLYLGPRLSARISARASAHGHTRN